jgi:thiol-disulfide isomerase/thioredoxin
MVRIGLIATVVVLSALSAQAQESKARAAGAEPSAADKVRDNPNDVMALNTLAGERLREVIGLIESQPDEALARLQSFEELLAGLKASTPAAKSLIGRIQAATENYRDQIAAARTPLAELEKQLVETPDNVQALQRYWTKVSMQIAPRARTEPDAAAQQLASVKATLAKVGDAAKEEGTRRQLEVVQRMMKSLEGMIEAGLKLTALIGKDAAPLGVEAWVNGAPLTDDDLKGKVVLLDFWAIWCGPCIATFPHLREWHEKYADKGLVIIGLTRYYEYDWNAAEQRASKVAGTSHEAEQAMLVQFAEHHGLKHRFGIQGDRDVSEFYGVTGIPHVVVIDQQGKIRLMRVGSGDKNAQDIGDLLAKLLGPA